MQQSKRRRPLLVLDQERMRHKRRKKSSKVLFLGKIQIRILESESGSILGFITKIQKWIMNSENPHFEWIL